MSRLDMMILKTECPKCGKFHYLRAWFIPTGYDENGHADETEVESIECPACGYNPPEDSPEYARVLELFYNSYYPSAHVSELGKIYQEMKGLCKKIDNCFKIDILKDKDMLDFQFAESVKKVCSKCKEFKSGATRPIYTRR